MKRKKSITRKIKKKQYKRMLASDIQNLRILASQIGKMIPATSQGKFSFENIAKEYKLTKYWPKSGSKQERIFVLLKNTYKYHPKLFYKIFRENFAKAIERRYKQGNPILQKEMEELNNTLKLLKINLTKEIKALNLPKERPVIVPPPFQFQQIIKNIGLHNFLLPDCRDLFLNGHINESARKSLEKLEVYIQRKVSSQLQGKKLMATVFSEQNPLIKIADVSTVRGKSLQEGFKFLLMGAMEFWRNYFSHGDEKQIPHNDAIAIITAVSHIMFYIDENNTD